MLGCENAVKFYRTSAVEYGARMEVAKDKVKEQDRLPPR